MTKMYSAENQVLNSQILCLGTGSEINGSLHRELPTSFGLFANDASILIEPTSALRAILAGAMQIETSYNELFRGGPQLFASSCKRPGELLALVQCLIFFRERHERLTVLGPEGITVEVSSLLSALGIPRSDLWEFVEMQPFDEVALGKCLTLTALPMSKNETGFELGNSIFVEQQSRVDPQKFKEHGLSPGRDIGRIIAGETINGISLSMIEIKDERRFQRLTYLPGRPTENVWRANFILGATVVARVRFLDEQLDLANSMGSLTATMVGQQSSEFGAKRIVAVDRSLRITIVDWLRNEIEQFGVETIIPRFGERLTF